ncbi:hypothetical protein [Martelella mediterranea]|uniref:Uncharacterized protein n=1 Tax=Martelella mediterranea DSM 17316 TaxID=1122214 RepID=A0A1U9YYL6_9HYPH|nr:hypothetical protein [Martelella mediterranea]AQZ50543.1 hypothetical protein Mame_01173 [Martelella mediterranea DSM 17316]
MDAEWMKEEAGSASSLVAECLKAVEGMLSPDGTILDRGKKLKQLQRGLTMVERHLANIRDEIEGGDAEG